MKVMVTGGAGYVGSHTCKALARAGHDILVYDNLNRGNSSAVQWGDFVHGDLNDSAALDAIIGKWRPDAVLHFAAFAYVGESMADPISYYRNNVSGSISLLGAMLRHDIKKIVFSSTCATYGVPNVLPITEDMPQNPINPYGRTKLMIEQLLADCEKAHGMGWMALRYFNAAGCDPEGEIGEAHEPETHVIPLAIKAALGSGNTFEVMGTDYGTDDGTAVRDYIHVADLADAHIRALEHLVAGGKSTALNLATGNGVSVKQLVESVERVTGRTLPVRYGPRRAGDPPALYASNAKAQEWLGWTPKYTDLDEIVASAFNWFNRHNNTTAP